MTTDLFEGYKCKFCDNNNPNIYPGATEVCNGVDDDCDGIIDDVCVNDSDNDGIIDASDNC